MMSITKLAFALREMTEWQQTPKQLLKEDYEKMIIAALKKLYVDTSRYSELSEDDIFTEDDEVFCNKTLPLDEEEYLMLLARIEFFKKVQTDHNGEVGYTTDAMSITNADKPYANLKDTIMNLENERRIIFYKMVRYWLAE